MIFKLIEADGGYGDLGPVPTAPSTPSNLKDEKPSDKPKIKYKLTAFRKLDDTDEVSEVQGNRDPKDKKIAKKIAKARSKIASKCSDSQSPQRVPGNTIKFVCKTKDKEKARKASKSMKKFNKSSAGKKASKVRQATKSFRKE